MKEGNENKKMTYPVLLIVLAWKEYCAKYWFKKNHTIQEGTDRCTGRRDITEKLLKTGLNTIQSIDQLKATVAYYI